MKWRHYVLVAFFLVSVVGLLGRVAYLSVTERRDFLKQRGEAIAVRTVSIPAHRGDIRDRHGELLAISTPVHSIWVDPSETTLSDAQLAAVGEVLAVAPEALQRRIASSGKRFAYLKRHVSPATAEAIEALGLRGVRSLSEYRRFYPAAETTAHVVGMTNIDDVGQEGIEYTFDSFLQGTPGSKRILLDNNRRTIEELGFLQYPDFGEDITVSLDLRLQFSAYRELKSAVEHNNAESGSLVMLDADTGEVLALANQPSFNPNNPAERTSVGVRNRAVTDTYEPGSTVKPLAALAALESGRYTPLTEVDTSPGYVSVGRKLVEDPSNRGVLTLSQVLAKSSQVGMTKIALDLPRGCGVRRHGAGRFRRAAGVRPAGRDVRRAYRPRSRQAHRPRDPRVRIRRHRHADAACALLPDAGCGRRAASGGSAPADYRSGGHPRLRRTPRARGGADARAGRQRCRDGAQSEGPGLSRGRQDRHDAQDFRRRI